MDHGDVVSSMVGGHAARNTLGVTKMSVDLHSTANLCIQTVFLSFIFSHLFIYYTYLATIVPIRHLSAHLRIALPHAHVLDVRNRHNAYVF